MYSRSPDVPIFLGGPLLARSRRSVEHHDDGQNSTNKRPNLGRTILTHVVSFRNDESFCSVVCVHDFVNEKLVFDMNDTIITALSLTTSRA